MICYLCLNPLEHVRGVIIESKQELKCVRNKYEFINLPKWPPNDLTPLNLVNTSKMPQIFVLA